MTLRSAARESCQRRGVLVAVRLLGQALEFLGWVVLARQLQAEALGEVTVAFLLCRYAGLLADWGARYRGVREVAAGAPLTSLAPLLVRRERLVAVLAVAVTGVAVAGGQTALLPLLAVLAQQGLNRDWLALGRHRMLPASIPALVQGAVLLSLGLVAPAEPWGAAAAVGSAYALALVASHVLNPLPLSRIRGGPCRGGGWMVTAVLADAGVTTLGPLLLAVLASPSDAGMYAVVSRLPNAWLAVVGLVSMSSMPLVAAQLATGGRWTSPMRSRALRAGLPAGGLALLGAPVVAVAAPVLFGPDYRQASGAAALLVVASAVTTVTAAVIPAYVAVVPDAAYARVQLSAAAVTAAAGLALIPALGILGAALATVAAQLLLLGQVWLGLTRTLEAPPPPSAQLAGAT